MTKWMLVPVLAAVLAGCEAPQSNPLIFGQAVTLGVSAAPSAAAPGAVDFAVGFKQADIAVVPTIVPGDVPTDGGPRQIVSHGDGEEQDTLSVFGSFSNDTSVNSTKIGVFFATGIAAQNLSDGFRCATSAIASEGCVAP